MIELVHEEEFALQHITGKVLVHKDHNDNTFSATVEVNELQTELYEKGFSTLQAADDWAWEHAYQEDEYIDDNLFTGFKVESEEVAKSLSINKQTMYEAVCRAQNKEIRPEDYGLDNNDYEALWEEAQMNGHLLRVAEGWQMFRDENGQPVYLFKECGFETPEELQMVWLHAKRAVEEFAEYVGVTTENLK